MNKIINPPCNSLETTSFIMPDERKKKVKVVTGGESSHHADGSEAAPDVGVPLIDQFPPDFPIVHKAVVGEEARRRVEVEGTEVDDKSDIISVGGPFNCWCVRVRGRHLCRGSWESWSHCSERNCFGYSWSNGSIVFKLLNNH